MTNPTAPPTTVTPPTLTQEDVMMLMRLEHKAGYADPPDPEASEYLRDLANRITRALRVPATTGRVCERCNERPAAGVYCDECWTEMVVPNPRAPDTAPSVTESFLDLERELGVYGRTMYEKGAAGEPLERPSMFARIVRVFASRYTRSDLEAIAREAITNTMNTLVKEREVESLATEVVTRYLAKREK